MSCDFLLLGRGGWDGSVSLDWKGAWDALDTLGGVDALTPWDNDKAWEGPRGPLQPFP